MWYCVARQAVGVTGAVDSFVMPTDEGQDIACRAKRFDDSRAIGWMPLDYAKLLRRQRARLIEDRVRRADFPDVVECCTAP